MKINEPPQDENRDENELLSAWRWAEREGRRIPYHIRYDATTYQ